MTRNEEITALLYRLYTDQTVYYAIHYQNPVVIEAEEMGLIYHKGNRYALKEEGILLVKSGRTYDDFLAERLPINHPITATITPHPINNQPGTVGFKSSWKRFILIINNDWIKLLVITVVGGLIIWIITK